MKLKITPGRWKKKPAPHTEELHARLWDIRDEFGCEIARVSIRDDSEREHANALAFKRVPEMLAFIAAHTHDEGGYRCPERFKCERCDEARALIEGLVEE